MKWFILKSIKFPLEMRLWNTLAEARQCLLRENENIFRNSEISFVIWKNKRLQILRFYLLENRWEVLSSHQRFRQVGKLCATGLSLVPSLFSNVSAVQMPQWHRIHLIYLRHLLKHKRLKGKYFLEIHLFLREICAHNYAHNVSVSENLCFCPPKQIR